MLKLKSILNEITNKYLYHVSPKKNLASIKQKGILPYALAPADLSDKKAVYLFKDRDEMEDAITNWLGDKFDEDEPLLCFTIYPSGLDIELSNVEYEVISYNPIPPKNIIKIENI